MSKIVCDICGTVYEDSAELCPICGYAHSEFDLDDQEDFLSDSPLNNRANNAAQTEEYEPEVYSDAHLDIPDYDDDDFEDEFEEDTKGRGKVAASTFVIILLVVIITLLLLAIGVLFFGFYLPNRSEEAAASQPVQTELVTEPVAEDTTEPRIPCTNLALTSGVTELTREGQYWLLHVIALPEDTTDPLVFVSEDESVVTVNEHGRLTAVGEGETTVHIACGDKAIKCKVIVRFEEELETEPTLDEQHTPYAVEHDALPEAMVDASEPVEAMEETKPTEVQQVETQEPTTSSGDVVLKLKEKDLSSTVRGVSFELKLDCDLKPEDVKWLTMDSKIAIVKNGIVTTVGPGQTKIVAQYNGQQAECIIRCNF